MMYEEIQSVKISSINYANNSCRGYINDSEATAKTFTEDGWVKSGDILKMDENQNFWVTDRLKEV